MRNSFFGVAAGVIVAASCGGTADRGGKAGDAGGGGAASGIDASDDSAPGFNGGGSSSGSGSSSGLGGGVGASYGSAVDASLAAFCAGSGGILIPNGGMQTCTGNLARSTFLFALCSCTDYLWQGDLVTGSFNSTTGATGLNGGNVGCDGNGTSQSEFAIHGSLWTGGALDTHGIGTVNGDVHCGAAWTGAGRFTVAGDAYAQSLSVSTAAVNGMTHVPASATMDPCNCSHPVDIAGIVDAFKNSNDDAADHVTQRTFANVVQATTVNLGCGRYYFEQMTGQAKMTVNLAGRTAVFVSGDFDWGGDFVMNLAPGAELDLFVDGNFTYSGSTVFGLPSQPARIRVYAAGTKVLLQGNLKFGANLYAVNANAQLDANYTMAGSILAQSLTTSGVLTVDYDEAILNVPACSPPSGGPAGCGSCHDCSGTTPACKNGTCTACASDSDCCAPLVCRGGACGADAIR